MKVTLVDYTQDAELKIGKYAAICYDSDTSDEACLRRASSCLKRGHLATLRFASAVFHITGMSRAGSEQALRHKFLDFLKRSQRYSDESEALVVVPPSIYNNEKHRDLFLKHAQTSRDLYKLFREEGIPKEDARYVLLLATETEFYVIGSLQAWRDFLIGNAGRLQKAAQWEIRAVALEIQRQLAEIAPNIFGEVNA